MVKDFYKHDETVKTSATPASDNLFNTIEDTIVLEETQAKIYHNFFSKALFSTKVSSP